MIPLADVALILGTGASVAVGGRWVVRAIFREDVQPLRETMLKLEHTVASLVEEMRESRESQKSDRDDIHAAVQALEKIVSEHERQLEAHERRIADVESVVAAPVPAPRSRRKRAT